VTEEGFFKKFIQNPELANIQRLIRPLTDNPGGTEDNLAQMYLDIWSKDSAFNVSTTS
jgi:hypothetical protein